MFHRMRDLSDLIINLVEKLKYPYFLDESAPKTRWEWQQAAEQEGTTASSHHSVQFG